MSLPGLVLSAATFADVNDLGVSLCHEAVVALRRPLCPSLRIGILTFSLLTRTPLASAIIWGEN